MSRPDDVLRLRHMRDHAAEVIAMSRHKLRPDLDEDRMPQLLKALDHLLSEFD